MKKDGYKFIKKVGESGYTIYKDCIAGFGFVGEVASSLAYAISHPRKIRWKETLYYMDSCGSDAVVIVSVVGFLVGLVVAVQGTIQLTKFGASMMIPDLVVLSLVKELGPLMAAIVATGRAGSAFAAEIGTMKVTEEVDAMIAMGFDLNRFLVIPKLVAMIIVMPILTVFGNIAGIIGGIFVGYFQVGISVPEFLNKTFEALTFSDYMQSFTKSIVFGIIIASVGCFRGLQTKNDSQSVGRSTTSSVVSSIFLLAVADTILSMIFCLFQQ